MVSTHELPQRWTYYGCSQEEVARVEQCWRANRERVIAKTAELSDAASQLQLVVEHADARPSWRLHAVLYLPGTAVTARGEGLDVEAAFEALLTELVAGMDQRQDRPTQVTRRREGIDAVEALLGSYRQKGRSEAFISLLVPLAASLGPYAAREIQAREMEGKVSGTMLTLYDVLDEVLLKAWEQYPARGQVAGGGGQPLDLWLMHLADEAIDRLGQPEAEVSTDEEVEAVSTEPGSARRDEWVEQVSYFERVELNQLLPGRPGIGAWESSELEQTQRRLSELLSGLPRERRQALLLHAVFGFNGQEIADFQDRSRNDVDADISAAFAKIDRDVRKEDRP